MIALARALLLFIWSSAPPCAFEVGDGTFLPDPCWHVVRWRDGQDVMILRRPVPEGGWK